MDEAGKTPGAHGGGGAPRSSLTDIAEQTVIPTGGEKPRDPTVPAAPGPSRRGPVAEGEATDGEAAGVRARRRRFLDELGEFRRSRVLVPVGTLPGPDVEEVPLTVDMGEARWILAFTGEGALARYAAARGEDTRTWRYRSVWGAALLDAAVPAVAESGVPCGVVVDAADGAHALVLPPVAGVVPDAAAVNGPDRRDDGEAGR
nr:hypothetical protein [Streptomyces lavendulae]